MKNILPILLLLMTTGKSSILLAQGTCPNSYTKSPLMAEIHYLSGGQVTDVVSPGQIYYLKIKSIPAVMSNYPTDRAQNIGVQINGFNSTTSGFTLHQDTDTGASNPFSNSVVQSGVGPDVGSNQTATFVIKINSDNYDGQISFNGGYYMCIDYYDSNSLAVYKIMPVKLLVAP